MTSGTGAMNSLASDDWTGIDAGDYVFEGGRVRGPEGSDFDLSFAEAASLLGTRPVIENGSFQSDLVATGSLHGAQAARVRVGGDVGAAEVDQLLHDLGREEALASAAHRLEAGRVSRRPAARSRRTAGATRSTSISTVAGSPCSSGSTSFDAGSMSSSTRTRPSRTSLDTRATTAASVPYWTDGKPSSRSRAV